MDLLDPMSLELRRIENYRRALARAYDTDRSTWQARLNQAEEHFRILSDAFLGSTSHPSAARDNRQTTLCA